MNGLPLIANMHALARVTPRHAGELTSLADAFASAATGFYADPPTVSAKKFMGAWARARKLYSTLSHTPLA
jgi:hypothetical protein